MAQIGLSSKFLKLKLIKNFFNFVQQYVQQNILTHAKKVLQQFVRQPNSINKMKLTEIK